MVRRFLLLLLFVLSSSSIAAGSSDKDVAYKMEKAWWCSAIKQNTISPESCFAAAYDAGKPKGAPSNGTQWVEGGSVSCSFSSNGTEATCKGQYKKQCFPPALVNCPYGSYEPVFSSRLEDIKKCPDGSALNSAATACTCGPGLKASPDKLSCKADCDSVKDKPVSAGYYDIGATAGASPKLLVCAGKCEAVFDGESPAGSAMVNGEKHWFAKGEYIGTGNQCTAAREANDQVGAGTPGKPEDSCKPGEAKGTFNGKTVCVPQSGEGEGKPSKDSENKATKTTSKTIQTNPDGSTTEIETTVEIDSDGNKKVTKTTTTKKPDGSSSTQTEVTNGGKWPAGRDPDKPDDGKDDDEKEKDKCEKNSSDEGCGGKPAPVSDLYKAKDKTVSNVLQGHMAAFRASPFGGAVSNFFSVSAGGSCPRWSASIPYLKTDISFDQFCSDMATGAFAALRVCVLLVASFFAFRIALE